MSDKTKYTAVATKLSPYANERLEKIARKKGMTKYDIIQMMCDVAIRYMDDRHNLTPEMERAMQLFEHMIGWGEALNLADPSVATHISEAFYALTDEEGKKKGSRMVMVRRPFFGTWDQTENVQQIFERMTELLLPEMYQRLRFLAQEQACNSIFELLNIMLDKEQMETLDKGFRDEFEDANRSEYGRKPTDAPYRRKHHKDVDSAKGLDFRPFDVEW